MHLDWTTSWDHSFEASPNSLRAELHLLKVPIFLGLARMLKYEAGSSSYIETPADIGKIYYGYRYELLGTLHQTFKTFSPAPCAKTTDVNRYSSLLHPSAALYSMYTAMVV
ncbi:hypothetical protein V6N13_138137 [Hibiscus sabdariffa]